MKILVINTGSSSIKYQLFDMETEQVLTAGMVEKIGEQDSGIKHAIFPSSDQEKTLREKREIPNHRQGMQHISQLLLDQAYGVLKDADEIGAVGHRAVHGGEYFSKTTVIDADVKARIKELSPLAPLHNPLNLVGIEVAEEIFPHAKHVAVFDTAFHQTMPANAYRYAIPEKLYKEHGIRVYGFHGTSHLYVSKATAKFLGIPAEKLNLITIHLGNGCSMAAVKQGLCIDTSMGLSPLGGLVMGTRSGDVDPALFYFIGKEIGLSFDEVDRLLNKESGLKGMAGTNDVREVLAKKDQGDKNAQLALDVYTYRIKKYIGAYMAALSHTDALVFTAGVGENSSYIRQQACLGLEELGVRIDQERNQQRVEGIRAIHQSGSKVKVLVVPTNEELEIAHQTLAAIQ